MACTLDFRSLDEGLGGERNKRKRSADHETSMEVEHPSAKRSTIAIEGQDKPVYSKPTYDDVITGKVSGCKWKQAKTTCTSALKVSHKCTTFEERSRAKEITKAYKERIGELKEQIRVNKAEKRKKKEELVKQKKENELRSGMELQKITNPKTLKKMSNSNKKKLLRVVPDVALKK